MRWFSHALMLGASLLAAQASAQKFGTHEVAPQPYPQQPQVIQRIYVSPGASGRIDSSANWQRYDGQGGYRVPRSYGNSGSTTIIRSGSGGIRQSTEYPNGVVYPSQPYDSTIRRQNYP
ncbi:hypothetical protein D3C76_725570 [compost metagenome]|uniref:Nickel/cobalt transporter regulator n=1 Tax=Pseudomonas jinjuensis TaxID=198616 RepID=A0A1H0DEQ9_9PSED|nr:hypothetical protein [Pseudomonas jinjuensis]SDN68602.1 hypothetical protein SAMN05216193_104263 [Pseudomonas jinjuensis]